MATTSYSALYDSSGNPISGRPKSSNAGPNDDYVIGVSYATTDLDLLDDAYYLIPVRSGKTIVFLDLGEWTDLDSGAGALDMDIVLRTTSGAGTVTDTILYNAGTAFATAQTAGAVKRIWCNAKVPDCATSVGHIISKINTAASTPNAGTGNLLAKVI